MAFDSEVMYVAYSINIQIQVLNMINQKKRMLGINVTEVLNYMCPVIVVIKQGIGSRKSSV